MFVARRLIADINPAEQGSAIKTVDVNALIAANGFNEDVVLAGTFCSGNCQKGVCITVDGKDYSVTPNSAAEFFQTVVIPGVNESR